MAQNALKVQTAVKGIVKQLKTVDEQQQYYLLTQLIERLPEEFVAALAFAYDVRKVGEPTTQSS
jgi:hypothetical protein